jgi:hypothetical protein
MFFSFEGKVISARDAITTKLGIFLTMDLVFLPFLVRSEQATSLFAWLISHPSTVLFSQNKPVTSNQPAVLFSQNKSALAISHQSNDQALHM